VTLQHLRTFIWLRWRIRINQIRRGGTVNAVILAILAILGLLLAVVLFAGLFLVGWLALPRASPAVVMFVWDGLALAFLFTWCIGLLTDLQRFEALSLQKFLHLPVSPGGAFVVNYVSSLVSFNLIVFAPAMLGLTLGLALGRGPVWLLLLPVVLAFLLMVTALTHQFQSWLGALMSNPRRRRTVIVVMTLLFIVLVQVPNLLNIINQPWKKQGRLQSAVAWLQEQDIKLSRERQQGRLTQEEYQRRKAAVDREYQEKISGHDKKSLRQLEQTVRLVNLCLPPGWLPWGALGLAEGDVLPALLGTLGLALFGTFSLWRSYRTTLRLYRGEFASGSRQAAAPARPAAVATGPPRTRMLERQLPVISEQAAAIALAGFRSLLRAPEAKMVLLSPIIMVVVFGSLLFTSNGKPAEILRPLIAFGGVAMVLFSTMQLIGNQFGYDRGGFRVFVLCPAPRRDVLLGKNLAVAPLALGLAALLVAALDVIYPMRLDHLLALLPTALSMYLLFCLTANLMSLFAPMAVAAGAFKPSNPKGLALLLTFVFLFLFPVMLTPALLPLGIEAAAEGLGYLHGVPIFLLLALAECVGIVALYRLALNWQGSLLAAREQKILEVVARQE
jgi:ABC-2 type transport system permease protein